MKKTVKISALALLIAALVTIGAYVGFYALGHRALPGTYVGKVKVAGLTQAEIQERINLGISKSHVSINGEGINATTATIQDMGFSVDAQSIAAKALETNSIWWKYATAPFTSHIFNADITMDASKASSFANQLTEGNSSALAPVNPQIVFKDTEFVITPGANGKGVDARSLSTAAEDLASTLADVTFTASVSDIEPLVKESDLQPQLDAANDLLAPDVSVGLDEKVISATPADKAAWITLDGESPALDETAIEAWVQSKAHDFKVDGVTGERLVNKHGTVIQVRTEAKAAVEVDNVPDIVSAILAQTPAGTATAATFTVSTSEPQWTTKTIADGGENLPYPAAEGEKWIDINLGTGRMMAYEGATPVHGPVSIISGVRDSRATVVGTYKTYLKYQSQTMQGTNPDGSEYTSSNVPWVMYFHRGYAIHGAPWWGAGAWGNVLYGSHGCVNTPVGEANWFYNWAPLGTTVVTHF